MKRFIAWCRFTALFCLFNQGVLVWGRCTEQNFEIQGGTYTLSNQFEAGSTLKYQCEEGFYPYPDLARVCDQAGKWEPAPRRTKCRPVECPDPAVLENCNVLPSEPNYFYQNQITYECYEGYRLYGPMHRTCLSSGKWSGSHPVCRRESGEHCPDPGVPPGGSRTGSVFNIGEKVTYTCNNNDMILIGSEERVCQEDHHWSGKEPTCYYQHTYDTPLEVSQEFAGGIKNTFASLETETNVTQEGRTIRLTKSGILNIYIALDVSSSISPEQFESAKKAVITLIHKIASFSVTPNYEVVFFSSKPIVAIDILSFFDDNKKSLAELVKHLETYKISRRDKAGTNLNAVFEEFIGKMGVIKQRQPNFDEHQHVIIIFTDGGYNMGGKPTPTVERIKSMILKEQPERKKHLDIYIFAIGATIYDRNLRGLTFGIGEKHYFRLKDEKELHKTFDEIINEEDVKGLCGLHRNYGHMYDLKTKRSKYPWVVFVNILTSAKTSYCLGSLVTPRFVLTAAHCFTVDDLITEVKVELYDGLQLDVKTRHTHPLYNISARVEQGVPEFYDYDVTLIELVKDVTISVSLRPICLPCTEETNGALRETLTCTEQEQFLITNNERVNFLTKRNLAEKFAILKLGGTRLPCLVKALTAPGITTKNVSMVVNDNFLCSGGISGGTSGEVENIACRGDSGGAVFKNHLNRTIQVALVSWGSKVMDMCDVGGIVNSDEESRDFHFNLFKVVPFLKSILGRTDQDYAPLVFVD